jgi:hypothetical protein
MIVASLARSSGAAAIALLIMAVLSGAGAAFGAGGFWVAAWEKTIVPAVRKAAAKHRDSDLYDMGNLLKRTKT